MRALDLANVSPAALAVVAGVVCVVIAWVAIVLASKWRRASEARQLRARMDHAARGEARGGELLVRGGYAILGYQCGASWEVRVDDVPIAIPLRADYLVARDGRRFVAEVKTGREAPRIESASTRRQLLEYRFAFDVDGVLLVDAEAETIREVVFTRVVSAASSTRSSSVEPSASSWRLVPAAVVLAIAVFVLARVL